MPFLAIINNISLLLALSITYAMVVRNWHQGQALGKIITGILFGLVTIAGMINSFKLSTGIIFDGRSVVISVAGLFLGPLTAATAVILASCYRILIGGAGVLSGLLTLVSSGIIGTAGFYLRKKKNLHFTLPLLFFFGFIVHIFIFVIFYFSLPSPYDVVVFKQLAFPFLTIFPIGTVILGKLISGQNERIRTKKELQESEARFRALTEKTTDWAWEVDIDGRYTYASPVVREILGYAPEKLLGKTPMDFMLPAEAERIGQEFFKIKNEQRSFTALSNVNLHKDGHEVILESSGVPIFDGDKLIGYRGINRDITKRTQAKRELARNHALLKCLIDSIPDLIFYKDKKSVYLGCNEAFAAFAGRKEPKEIIGHTDFDFFPQELAEFFREKDRQMLAGKKPRRDEGWVDYPDGRHVLLDTLKTPYYNPEGKILGLIGISRDITESFRDEEQRKSEYARFQNILDSFEALVYIADMESYELLFINKYGRNIWGDIVGKTCWKTLQADQTGPCSFCTNDRLLNDDEEPSGVYIWEFQNTVTNDWFECRDQAIRWTDGRFVRMEIATEITMRKQTEEKFKRVSRALLALSNVNEAVIRSKTEDELVQKICRILVKTGGYRFAWLGYAEHDEEKSVRPVTQAGSEDDYLGTIKISWADNEYGRGPTGSAIRTGEPRVIRDILADPGYSRWREQAMKRGYASSIALPLKADQDVFGALNIYADIPDAFDPDEIELLEELAENLAFGIITIRHRAEARKAEEEKTTLLSHLRQAQKMEAIGTLAGGIAHDFNNMLVPILAYSEMLLESLPDNDQEAKHDLTEVLKAAKRARDLVKQILTFSRQTEHELEPLQITPIVKETLKLLKASLPSNIETRFKFNADKTTIFGDPTHVQQIVMNLCTNSYHAMKEKGGLLEVVLDQVEIARENFLNNKNLEPGHYVQLSINDTGCGIDKAVLEKIFDPYFTTKKQGEGTGLGLSIVHGIIKNYGGDITVYSEIGIGTTFHVYIPAITATQDPDKLPKEILPHPRGIEHILLVDDEEPIIGSTSQILESLGYKVTARTDSLKALELFKNQCDDFDLVITDQTMPKMTGDSLAQEMLQIRPDIPIILCTGFSSMIDESKAKQIGIKKFLMKPLIIRDLATAIRIALENK